MTAERRPGDYTDEELRLLHANDNPNEDLGGGVRSLREGRLRVKDDQPTHDTASPTKETTSASDEVATDGDTIDDAVSLEAVYRQNIDDNNLSQTDPDVAEDIGYKPLSK